jgi:hypothetical protein
LDGRSPAQAYCNARPSPEDFEKILAYFKELERKQEKMRLLTGGYP